MSLALAAVMLVAAPVVDAPCDAPLQGTLRALAAQHPGGGSLRLAPACTYEVDLRFAGEAPVTLIGSPGSRIAGRVVVDGAGAVTLRDVAIEGPVAPLVVRGAGALTLERVTLTSGDDALHIYGGGEVVLRDCAIAAEGTAVWVEQAASFRLDGGSIRGGEQALVVRGVKGSVRLERAHVEAGPSLAPATVRVEGPGPLSIVGNVFVHLPAPGVTDAAVLDLDVPGVVAENDFRTGSLAVRARRPFTLACNRFRTLVRTVQGAHERACPRDLAPDTLDWRSRKGGPDAESCRQTPGGGPCPELRAEVPGGAPPR